MSGVQRFVSLLAACGMASAVLAEPAVRGVAGARVEIFSDAADRVWVAVDRDSDGAPEDLYGFVSREPALPGEVLALLPVELTSASILVSEGQLRIEEAVAGGRAGQTWELSIDPDDPEERIGVESRGRRVEVALANGAALGRYDLSLQRPVRANFRDVRESLAPRLEPVAGKPDSPNLAPQPPVPPCPTCSAGGQGAQQCTANCGASLSGGGNGFLMGATGAVSLQEGCGVSCGAGYFACCNCSLHQVVFLEEAATCRCISSRCN